MKTSGTLMPNHRKQSANSVPKGTAPLERWPHTSRLSAKKMQKTTPGKSSAVLRVVFFHSSPCSHQQGVAQWAGFIQRKGEIRVNRYLF